MHNSFFESPASIFAQFEGYAKAEADEKSAEELASIRVILNFCFFLKKKKYQFFDFRKLA